MAQKPEFAWGLIASMYLGNMALLALNIFAIPLFVQMIKLPYRLLAPAVILICTVGTYSVNGSLVETWLMFVAGVAGFFMKRLGFSPAALVLALVLGPLAEQSLRQSLTISHGSLSIFVERPMSLWILGVTAVAIALGVLMRRAARRDASV
jgi:putative tricarboxylic transport membrane protein